MSKLEIDGPADEVIAFWTQFFSRPVGFGFFNTFYPEPPGLDQGKSQRWRQRHWGMPFDIGVQSMRDGKDVRDLALANLTDAASVTRIVGLFPNCKFTYLTMNIIPVTGLLSKPQQLPDIFDMRWHRCSKCGNQLAKHAKMQCLFSPTSFSPALPIWRTVFGGYEWQPNSMSFVSTVGSTTTRTTIKAPATVQLRAKATGPKTKPTTTAKRATSNN